MRPDNSNGVKPADEANARVSSSISAAILRRWILLAICVPIFVYLLVPSLIILPMALTRGELIEFPPQWISIHSFVDYYQDRNWIDSTVVSLKVAVVAVFVSIVAGTCSALALHESKFPGKSVVVGVILAPLVVPLIVLGIADYLFFAKLGMAGSWIGIGMAHGLLATPLVYITVSNSLAGLNPALVRSATSLGANDINALRFVYWPAMRPGILAGGIFAFSISFDEVVVALFMQGANATTLPVTMFTSIQYDLTPKVAAVSSLLLLIAVLAMVVQMISLRGGEQK